MTETKLFEKYYMLQKMHQKLGQYCRSYLYPLPICRPTKLFNVWRQAKHGFIKLPTWIGSFQEEERDKKEMLFILIYVVS